MSLRYNLEDRPPSDSTTPSQQNRLPSRKATVGSLATGALSVALPHSRSEVVERINKYLAHAGHANVDENEAKPAIKMASKTMQQQNITQAQIMDDADDASVSSEVA